jgi:anti-sigma B factor antagonist
MEISTRKVDGITVFDLAGDVVMGRSLEALRTRLQEEIEGGAKRFVVNLEKVTYIDSSGAGTILATHTTAINAGGRCNFCGAPERVIAMLRVTRLEKVLNLFPDEASALSNFSGK